MGNIEAPTYINKNEILPHQRKLFVQLVMQAHGFTKLSQLIHKYQSHNKYEYDKEIGTIKPTNWHKYFRGEISPGNKTINRVETELPRAGYWLNLPMWEILEGPITKERLEVLLRQSRADIKAKLYKPDNTINSVMLRKPRSLFRYASQCSYLQNDSSIDALNTVILLVAELEAYGDIFNKPNMINLMTTVLQIFCAHKPFDEHYWFIHQSLVKRFYYEWKLLPKHEDLKQLELYDRLNNLDRFFDGHMEQTHHIFCSLISFIDSLNIIKTQRVKKLNKILSSFLSLQQEEFFEVFWEIEKYFETGNNTLANKPRIKALIKNNLREKIDHL